MARIERTPERLEAFSDGVIAVIVTIMVLELKVPRENGLAGLRAVLPVLLVYLLSFGFTTVYWVNHHHLLDRIKVVDERVLYANAVFLFLLSLLPFFTSYLLEKNIDSFAVSLYAASMGATAVGFLLLRRAILRTLRRTGKLEASDVAAHRKHIASFGLYVVAFPLARFHPVLALVLIATVTVLWVLPGFAAEEHPGDGIMSKG